MGRAEELEALLARQRAVSVRKNPRLARVASAMAAQGRLRRIHPGVYVDAGAPLTLTLRVLAARAWLPEAVFFGRIAARASLWPGLEVGTIDLADTVCHVPQQGLHLSRRRIPSTLVDHERGLRRTAVPLTVADLIPDLGGEILVRAFRAGVQLHEVEDALHQAAGRPGHRVRRGVLTAYRDIPWSVAEQELHVILRECGITDWQANVRVSIGDAGAKIFDVVLDRIRVAIEVDGFAFHNEDRRDVFERDRYAASALTARGWRVLRFTARQLFEQPDWVIAVIQATITVATAP